MNPTAHIGAAVIAVTAAGVGLAICGSYALTHGAGRRLLAFLAEALDGAGVDWALDDELRTLTRETA